MAKESQYFENARESSFGKRGAVLLAVTGIVCVVVRAGIENTLSCFGEKVVEGVG